MAAHNRAFVAVSGRECTDLVATRHPARSNWRRSRASKSTQCYSNFKADLFLAHGL